MIGGRVLDTSAVLDLAAGASVYGRALLVTATEHGIPLAIPTVALQTAWQHATVEGRPWLDLLPDAATVLVLPLEAAQARDVGLIAADAGHPDAPPGTVHAVYVARDRDWPLVTRDPDAALALSSRIRTETLP